MDHVRIARRLLCSIVFISLLGCAGATVTKEVEFGRTALLTNQSERALEHFATAAKVDPKFLVEYGPLQQSVWTYVGRAQYQAGHLTEARNALKRAVATFPQDRIANLYIALIDLQAESLQREKNSGLTLDETAYLLKRGVSSKRVAAIAAQRGTQFRWNRQAETKLSVAGADTFLINQLRNLRPNATAATAGPQVSRVNTDAMKTAFVDILQWLDNVTAVSGYGQNWDNTSEIRNGIRESLQTIADNKATREILMADGEWLGKRLEIEVNQVRMDLTTEYRSVQDR